MTYGQVNPIESRGISALDKKGGTVENKNILVSIHYCMKRTSVKLSSPPAVNNFSSASDTSG